MGRLITLLVLLCPLLAHAAEDKQFVPLKAAEEAVRQALLEQGAISPNETDKQYASVDITSHHDGFAISYAQNPDPSIENLTYSRNGRFTANLRFSGQDSNTEIIPVQGRVEEVTQVPVLKTRMRSGNIISAGDIVWQDVPVRYMRDDMVTDTAQLVGSQPRSFIAADRPIRIRQLMAPYLVAKGSPVKITYNVSLVNLQTIGTALEDGTKGQMIQVQNTGSGKNILAKVVAENIVAVGTVFNTGLTVATNAAQ